MSNCEKCHAHLEEGAGFCPNCGNAVLKTIFCPNCGAKTSRQATICQSCGGAIPPENDMAGVAPAVTAAAATAAAAAAAAALPEATNPVKKPSSGHPGRPGKMWLRIAAAAVLLIIIAAVLLLFKPFTGQVKTSTLYLKDKELNFSFLNTVKPVVFSEIGASTVFGSSPTFLNVYSSIKFNKSGTRIFYPEIVKNDNGTMITSYYYRDLTKDLTNSSSPVKIDTEMSSIIQISEDGSKAFYIKGSDRRFYVNDLTDKAKIDSGVAGFYVNKAGNYLIYVLDDGTLYERDLKTDESVKIDSGAQIKAVFEDTTRLYYTKDGSLYFKEKGQDKVKLAADVYTVISIVDKTGCYYTRKNTATYKLTDYVQDDLAAADSVLTKPLQSQYTKQQLKTSYYGDYYVTVNDTESYNLALQAYNAKVTRDTLRSALSSSTITVTSRTLYYYDGTTETLVADNMGEILLNPDKSPVIAYSKYTKSEIAKVKLSQITNKSQVEALISGATTKIDDVFLTIKDSTSTIDQTKAVGYLANYSQTAFCYLDEIEDGTGTLMEVKITDGAAAAPVKIDDAVSTFRYLNESDSLIYSKDVKNGSGELYQDGNLIASDVLLSSVYSFKNSKSLIYYTDYSTTSKSGTLTILKNGKTQKIAADVSAFVAENEKAVVFLTDYNYEKNTGDALLYNGSDKTVSVDKDVTGLIWKSKMVDASISASIPASTAAAATTTRAASAQTTTAKATTSTTKATTAPTTTKASTAATTTTTTTKATTAPTTTVKATTATTK